MEEELNASLGYEKNKKKVTDTDNKRNGYSPKTVKSKFGHQKKSRQALFY